MKKILDRLFGNKIKIVTATRTKCHMEYEQVFVFHKEVSDRHIKDCLWIQKGYSVEKISKERSKNIISPEITKCVTHGKEKRIRFFD